MSMDLNSRLVLIGLRLAAPSDPKNADAAGWVDIEGTLLDAMAQFQRDARLASLIFSWVKVHGPYVVVEKLRKLAAGAPPEAAQWVPALAALSVEDGSHKWRKLLHRWDKPVMLFPVAVTHSAVIRQGATPWLERWNIIIPQGALRIRESDVLSPPELIAANRQYRNRYLYGPSWRADIITAIESGATTPSEVMRRVGCSYEPAHRIFTEYHLARTA